ncbi:hypothetical protein O3P69_009027 [Scylla paramamosain]|uniref:Uncharacterized protein n=1 Tax=Scylla paramamosain TaxID=85552 RepID=A0AAW0TPQ5_SCYPA
MTRGEVTSGEGIFLLPEEGAERWRAEQASSPGQITECVFLCALRTGEQRARPICPASRVGSDCVFVCALPKAGARRAGHLRPASRAGSVCLCVRCLDRRLARCPLSERPGVSSACGSPRKRERVVNKEYVSWTVHSEHMGIYVDSIVDAGSSGPSIVSESGPQPRANG